jgi:hypothetical protein
MSLGSVVLRPGARLAQAPGGAPFARARAGGVPATVVEVRGSHLRVAVRRSNDTIFGFVARSDGETEPIGQGSVGGIGYGTGFGTGSSFGLGSIECSGRVPLLVEQDGVLEGAGFVKEGKSMRVLGERETGFVVDFAQRSFSLEPGVLLIVEKADLDGCRVRVAPRAPSAVHRALDWPKTKPASERP